MNGKKVIAVSWWTFAYIIVAGAVFAFSAMGDCLQGTDGTACRSQGQALTNAVLIGELVTYVAVTWLLFFRRR